MAASPSRSSVAAMGKTLLVRQLSAVDDSMKSGVSRPTSFRRTSHGAMEGAALSGSITLPSDFNLYFGAPLAKQPRVVLNGYADRVPTVLVCLAQDMIKNKGLQVEGIFRITPDMGALKTTRDALNRGDGLLKNVDPVVTAALIKDFFRSLPDALLVGLSPSELAMYGDPSTAASDEKWARLLFGDALPEPNRSTFLWVLDLMNIVCDQASVNRMSPNALAVCFAPSLYWTKDMDMAAMQRTKDVQSIIQGALDHLTKVPSARDPV